MKRHKKYFTLSLALLTSCTIPKVGTLELVGPLQSDPETGAVSAGFKFTPKLRGIPSDQVVDYTAPDKEPVDVDA